MHNEYIIISYSSYHESSESGGKELSISLNHETLRRCCGQRGICKFEWMIFSIGYMRLLRVWLYSRK